MNMNIDSYYYNKKQIRRDENVHGIRLTVYCIHYNISWSGGVCTQSQELVFKTVDHI